jgi:hypothetical protein
MVRLIWQAPVEALYIAFVGVSCNGSVRDLCFHFCENTLRWRILQFKLLGLQGPSVLTEGRENFLGEIVTCIPIKIVE